VVTARPFLCTGALLVVDLKLGVDAMLGRDAGLRGVDDILDGKETVNDR